MFRRALPAVLLLVVLLAAPTVADASPSPEPVAPASPAAFAAAAGNNGVDLGDSFDPEGIPASTARVEFSADGAAVWTVRHELAAGPAETLRRNPGTMATIADEALAVRDGQGVTDATEATARMDGDVVVLTVRDPDAARRGLGGHLLVDAFHPVGGHVNPVLGVDRLTAAGPAPVTHAPADWTVKGSEATLAGESRSVPYGYIAFGRDGPPGSAEAAVVLALLPVALPDVPLFVLTPTLVFAVGLVGHVAAGRRLAGSAGGAAALGVGVGAVAAVAAALLLGLTGLGGAFAPIAAAGVGLAALYAAATVLVYRDWRSPRAVTLSTLAALAASGTVTALAVGPVTPLVVWSLGLVFAAGYAGRRRGATLWGGAASLLFAAAAFVGSWSTMTTGGSFAVLTAVLWCAIAVLAVVAGLPLFLAGRALASSGRPATG